MRRFTGRARIALASLVTVASLFLFVFPSQALLAQRGDITQAEREVALLREQNAKLAEESARLQTPEEIERLARQQFNMVRPGEEAFAVIPAPAPTTTTTAP
jgi:cell division protein FtsL